VIPAVVWAVICGLLAGYWLGWLVDGADDDFKDWP